MNTKLRQKTKNNFEKDFFKLMNNALFEKTIENVRKYRDIKLLAIEKGRNYLLSGPNYRAIFCRKFIRNKNEKTQILMNAPVYLGLSILDLRKTVTVLAQLCQTKV